MTIKSDGRVTPWSDRKLVMPVGSINQPQSYFTVLSGTPRRAPLWKLLPPSSSRYRADVTRSRKKSSRLSCESTAEKISLATRRNPAYAPWKDFRP
nr:PREDICTED: uncharacterized protein LOC105677226 isoform X2 [Linepithema humile]